MRNNSPVTQQEYVIEPGHVLVSETDLHGNIVYANQAFIEVSGYSWEELEGQPHNLIRHPDVPEIVFEDLWTTLKNGSPWHQYVKNRRKTGDHYWVEANIAPVIQNGKTIGYKSVRNPIPRELIPAVEKAYVDVAKGKLLIREGTLLTPWSQRLAKWSPLPQKSILGKTMIPLVIMAIMWSIVLQIYLQNVADNLYDGAVKDRQELLIKNLDAEIKSQSQIALTNAVGIAGNSAVIYGLYNNQQTVVWQIIKVNYEQYVERAKMDGIGITVFDADLKKVTSSGVNIELDTLPSEPVTRTHLQTEGGYIHAFAPIPYGDKIIGTVAFSLPLKQLIALEKEADRDYATVSLSQNTLSPIQGFKQSPVASILSADINQSLLNDGFAISGNRLLVFEPIKENDTLVGGHVVVEPMMILEKLLSDTYFMIYVAQGAMSGGFILLLIQVLWRMRNFVLRPMKQLTDKLHTASDTGSLSIRADIRVDDEIGKMARSFNEYVNSVQHLMISVSDMINALSKGDLSFRLHSDAKGDLDILKNQVNGSAANIHNVITEIEQAILAIKQANYNYESKGQFEGDFAIMVKDLQDAMRTTHDAITGINGTMKAISEGNFSSRLDLDLMGELDELKQNINGSLDQLEAGITEAVEVVVAQSEGDLTRRIDGDYLGKLGVMKEAVNTSLENVGRAISELMVSSKTVNSASEQIASGSSDLSDRIQNQAVTLQETVSSMEMITQTVRKNAENAGEASNLAAAAKEQADNGASVMAQTMTSMGELTESSQKIADIIGLIDSIAFQTNLLALNAAVEAARAGEHGRGFAVVAGEVRTLAGKSADAAKDIRNLIETSVTQVSHSESLVKKSEQEFASIVDSILQMHRFIADIAQANSEQTEGVERINRAIEGMDGVTQQNAALVEETAAAADTLRGEADQMKDQVGFFNTQSDRLGHGVNRSQAVIDSFQINHDAVAISESTEHSWDLALTKRAFRTWVNKLQAYINDVGNATRDDFNASTGFTEWLHHDGANRFGEMAEFNLISQLYPTLRKEILQAYDYKAAGQVQEAATHFIIVNEMAKSILDQLEVIEQKLR